MPSGPALPPLSSRLGAPSYHFDATHLGHLNTEIAGHGNMTRVQSSCISPASHLERSRSGSPQTLRRIAPAPMSSNVPPQFQNLRVTISSPAADYSSPAAPHRDSGLPSAPLNEPESQLPAHSAPIVVGSRDSQRVGGSLDEENRQAVAKKAAEVRRVRSAPSLTDLDGPISTHPAALGRSLSSNVRYLATPPPLLPSTRPAAARPPPAERCTCSFCHPTAASVWAGITSQAPSPASSLEFPNSPSSRGGQEQGRYWPSGYEESDQRGGYETTSTWPSLQSLASTTSWEQDSPRVLSGLKPQPAMWRQPEGGNMPGMVYNGSKHSTSPPPVAAPLNHPQLAALPPRHPPPRMRKVASSTTTPLSGTMSSRGEMRRQTYPTAPLPRTGSELQHWLEASPLPVVPSLGAFIPASQSGPVLKPFPKQQEPRKASLDFAFPSPSPSKSQIGQMVGGEESVSRNQGGKKSPWCWRCGGKGSLNAWCIVCGGEFAACRKCTRMREAHGRRGDTCLCGSCMSKPLPMPAAKRGSGSAAASAV